MSAMTQISPLVHEAEERLLADLRALRHAVRKSQAATPEPLVKLTLGQRVADSVAAGMGSWAFIIIQSVLLLVWIALNVTAYVQQWDPYPFILLNLALSFQAAYTAPVIMMSQNRQQDIDRASAENDYRVNVKAELEIELLHQKIDALREKEMLELAQAVRNLTEQLEATTARLQAAGASAIPISRRPSTSSTSWWRRPAIRAPTAIPCRAAFPASGRPCAAITSAVSGSSWTPKTNASSPLARRRGWPISPPPSPAPATSCWCPTPAIRSIRSASSSPAVRCAMCR